ncbi:hypothetical protein CEXT_134771, partial [Caerostris extrusa]
IIRNVPGEVFLDVYPLYHQRRLECLKIPRLKKRTVIGPLPGRLRIRLTSLKRIWNIPGSSVMDSRMDKQKKQMEFFKGSKVPKEV